jgi:hypothetical protein
LKIATLPEGLKMFITDVRFDIPKGNNQWWPTFAGINKNSSVRRQAARNAQSLSLMSVAQ